MPRIVGIDLGTTNSLVATVRDGKPVVLPDSDGHPMVPSVVSTDGEGGTVVGRAALAKATQFPDQTIYSVKRLLGRDGADLRDLIHRLPYRIMAEEGDMVRVKIGHQWLTPIQVSAEILRTLKRQAEDALGALVEAAVITVPAYFNDGQRQATRDAGKLAGLNVLRIVNEPTAACLAYGLQERQEGNIAVFDLGGGTFDVSILRVQVGIFEVLATNGDTELGGDDIDRLLAKLIVEQASEQHGIQLTPTLLSAARLAAEQLKKDLTTAEEATARLVLEAENELVYPITRAKFERLIRPLLARTLECSRRALEDADLLPEEIDEVVLVGGSTRIPLLQRMVADYFGKKPHTEINPDEVVALGAAVQADILAGNRKDLLLLDVTPLSLGIETYGGGFSKLIPRNSTVPCSISDVYTTFVDNQTHVDVHVLQGEHEVAKGNRSLARFKLGPLPAMPAGLARIQVTFTLDADGILSVTAVDQRTGTKQSIDVKPTYGLSEEELDAMLKASSDASEEEKQSRLLIEEKNYAELTRRATKRAIDEVGDIVDELDLIVAEEQLSQLEKAITGSDYMAIRSARERTEAAAKPLAIAMMNAALARDLRGKKAKEVFGGEEALLTPQQVNPDHQKSIKVEFPK